MNKELTIIIFRLSFRLKCNGTAKSFDICAKKLKDTSRVLLSKNVFGILNNMKKFPPFGGVRVGI